MSQATSTPISHNLALVAVGANLPSDYGDAKFNICKALADFSAFDMQVRRRSKLYVTPCFPAGYGPDYLNAVIEVAGEFDPKSLLTILHQIENNLGRKRESRWGGRVLDLDLLAMGDTIVPDEAGFRRWQNLPLDQQVQATPDHLILPHPRIQDRGFVLVPLMDVAPDWMHPVLKQSVRQLHSALSAQDLEQITPIDWP